MIDTKKLNEILDRMQREGRLPLVEMHIIRAIGPTLLNRDFNNSVKKVTFGGTIRVRFSSQSLMKAIRDYRQKMNEMTGIHSRYLPEMLSKEIKSRGEQYSELADFIKETFSTNKKNKGMTAQILVYGKDDIKEITEIIINKYNEDPESFLKDKKTIDILNDILKESAKGRKVDDMTALKGRMSTDTQYVESIESAASVNHAYSVDQWRGDIDSFTATEDADRMLGAIEGGAKEIGDSLGSAMIDDLDIAANVFYQYANIDTRTLLENTLRGVDLNDEEAINKAIERMQRIAAEFIEDFATMLPEAKQHSMASKPKPTCMLITTKKWARAQSADSEFEKNIEVESKRSVAEIARDRLVNFANNIQNGAFVAEKLESVLWFEDGNKDNIPVNAKRSTIETVKTDIFG